MTTHSHPTPHTQTTWVVSWQSAPTDVTRHQEHPTIEAANHWDTRHIKTIAPIHGNFVIWERPEPQ